MCLFGLNCVNMVTPHTQYNNYRVLEDANILHICSLVAIHNIANDVLYVLWH